jgi:hypothetical protein
MQSYLNLPSKLHSCSDPDSMKIPTKSCIVKQYYLIRHHLVNFNPDSMKIPTKTCKLYLNLPSNGNIFGFR